MKTADDLADDVVTELNSVISPIAFTAVNPADGVEVDREATATSVQVSGYSESETVIDRGWTVEAVREVNVVITKTLDDGETLKDCLAWLGILKATLVGKSYGDFLFESNETVVLYDLEALRTMRQFLSLFRVRFRGYA